MARSTYWKANVTGLESIQAVLRGLPDSVRGEIMTTAMRDALKPIVTGARALVPVRTGALKKSISSVVRRYQGGNVVVGIAGPDKGRYVSGKRLGKGASAAGSEQPSKYAHLVEFGHMTGKGVVAINPFMRPAVEAAAPTTGEVLAAGVERGIEKQRAKLAKAGVRAA